MDDKQSTNLGSPVTWVLISDGRDASIYSREVVKRQIPVGAMPRHTSFEERVSFELLPVSDMKWEAESVDIYQIGRNATGMVFQSGSSARHMSEPRIDARLEVKLHFAQDIAKSINEAKEQKRFDSLVVCAPPKMLGEFRKLLNSAALKSITAEIPKNLIHFDRVELNEHLKDVFLPAD